MEEKRIENLNGLEKKTLLNCTNAADGTRPWPAKFKNRHWQLDGLVSKSSDIDGQQRSFGATAETHFRHYLSVCHCLVNLCGLKEECVGDFTRDAQLRVSMKQKKERVLKRAQLNGIYWRAGPVEERQKKKDFATAVEQSEDSLAENIGETGCVVLIATSAPTWSDYDRAAHFTSASFLVITWRFHGRHYFPFKKRKNPPILNPPPQRKLFARCPVLSLRSLPCGKWVGKKKINLWRGNVGRGWSGWRRAQHHEMPTCFF